MIRRKKRQPEKRNQERYSVTLQLVYGADDDLIELIQNTAQGERQAGLKSALRRALELPEPLPPMTAYPTLSVDVEQRLNAMQTQLDKVHMLKGGAIATDTNEDIQQLRQELSAIKAALSKLNAVLANSAGQSFVPDDEPTVDTDTLARRDRQLRKTNW